MKVIDMQTSFFPSLGEQATYIIYKKDDGGYKVTVKVGDESKSCEWGMLSLCYDWACGYMMMTYGVGI
jgi:hypothetical protein